MNQKLRIKYNAIDLAGDGMFL